MKQIQSGKDALDQGRVNCKKLAHGIPFLTSVVGNPCYHPDRYLSVILVAAKGRDKTIICESRIFTMEQESAFLDYQYVMNARERL